LRSVCGNGRREIELAIGSVRFEGLAQTLGDIEDVCELLRFGECELAQRQHQIGERRRRLRP
jgi:hypothetical protein